MKEKKTTQQTIGANIKSIRIIKGFTQEKVAEHLGITAQQIQKYENGKNSISAEKLHKIAFFLNTRVSDFFPPEKTTTTSIDTRTIAAFAKFQKMNVEQKRVVLNVINEVSK